MSVATLTGNKLRSTLTMLGMVIGNAAVIATIGIGQGAQKLAAEQFESLGPNTLFVVPGNREARNTTFDLPKTLVYEDALAIASQVPSVAAVAPQISLPQVITYRERNTSDPVLGTVPAYQSVRSLDVAKGRFLQEIDLNGNRRVAVLGAEIAADFFGDRNPVGDRIRIKDTSFEIVGVLEAKGTFLGENQDNRVYVPLTTMSSQLVGNTSPFGIEVSFISISARDEASIRAAEFQITNLLRLRHKISGEDDFGVQTQKDILEVVNTITNGLTFMLAAVAGISLLVGGIGVMNIMLVAVSERTQEIGLRKAIGASERDILTQFLIEATILAAVGGLLGTAVGIGTVGVVGVASPLSATISPVAIALAVGV
ncbi:MAG: ABC transporter permease [Cyanobacteria bacterium J06641_5]